MTQPAPSCSCCARNLAQDGTWRPDLCHSCAAESLGEYEERDEHVFSDENPAWE